MNESNDNSSINYGLLQSIGPFRELSSGESVSGMNSSKLMNISSQQLFGFTKIYGTSRSSSNILIKPIKSTIRN